MQYNSFNNQKNKLENLWNKSQNIDNKISNDVKNLDIDVRHIDFTKNIIKINLAKNIRIGSSEETIFIASLPIKLLKFPDWAIPMSHIVPSYYFPSGFDISILVPPVYNALVINNGLTYRWNKKDNLDYELFIKYAPFANYYDIHVQNVNIPVFINLDLVIINDNNYYTTQTLGI